jgi:hypothetical protein
MHGELEPAIMEVSFLKGATHSAKPFELADNLRSVNDSDIKDFIKEHTITKIMISGHMEYQEMENPHGYIEYEVDEHGMDIILYRVVGDPKDKKVFVKIEEVHHYNDHDNKWVYHELQEIISDSGLTHKKVA